MARTLQLARGLRDADVRFFLAADEAEVYAQARALPLLCASPGACWPPHALHASSGTRCGPHALCWVPCM